MDFQSFKLHSAVMSGVRAAGYETPTPIQEKAIPPAMLGADVMGMAQTGTGKTAAFVLPILNRLMQGSRGKVRALVIAPTRELAEQTHESFQALGKESRVRSATVYGGVGMEPQIKKLRGGVEVVVACPGRLLDHMGRKNVDLSKLEVLVVDEADMMFDMGFLPDLKRILSQLPKKRQTMLFSATMPAEIRGLAAEILTEPVIVRVGDTAPADTVSHALYPVAQAQKTALLLEILRKTDSGGSVLVFTRTKHRAKRLGETLEKEGFPSASLQGNLSQNKRQAAMDGFRSGRYRILVATDIAARGIDVSLVSHVINFDIPSTPEAYIHRIGRTGRAARTGDAFTLVTGEDNDMVRAITRLLGADIERRTLSGFPYNNRAACEVAGFDRPDRPSRPAYHARQDRSGGQGGRPSSSRPRTPSRPASQDRGRARRSGF